MSLQILDRVQEVTSTTGIGAIALGGSPLGCIPFSGIGNGNSTYYTIDDNNGNWEVGLGIYSSGTNSLARNTVYASTNSGLLVSFSAGNKNIWLDAPAYLLSQIGGGSVTSGAITVGKGVIVGKGVGDDVGVGEAVEENSALNVEVPLIYQ